MQRYFLLIIGLVWTGLLSAQFSGVVQDQEGEPLPFVNISFGEQAGVTSDLDGRYEIPAGVSSDWHFSYVGFQPLTVRRADQKQDMTVVMTAISTELEAATVVPGVNPAHRIIRRAVENRKKNNPENLEHFSYYAYSKFWVGANPDSIDPTIDTLGYYQVPDSLSEDPRYQGQDSVPRIDSSGFKNHKRFSEQYVFFMETLTQRKFAGGRDNETVLAQRTSGFKNPLFALLVTQLQSFGFYDNYIGITGDDYLNPISPGSTARYFFILEDTLVHSSGDSSFVVSFRPRPNTGFRALQGVLTINGQEWAIENVRAQPAGKEAFPIVIRQEYQRFGEHTWFPVAFHADIALAFISVNGVKPHAIMRRRLEHINLQEIPEKRSISRAKLSIDESKGEERDTLLAQFRHDSLSDKEKRTYRVIDSISKEENLEESLAVVLAFSRGYIPWKKVNIDLGKIINYNVQEGWRFGLGLSTSPRWSEEFQLSAYYAYGIKDKTSKYGLETKWDLQKDYRLSWRVGYRYDLFETGGSSLPFDKQKGLVNDNYRRLMIEQWDQGSQFYSAWRIDPLPKWRYELRLQKERRLTRGDYRFQLPDRPAGSAFDYTSMTHSLRYAPREEFAETPLGKITLEGGYPVFYLSYERGFKDIWSGDFQYDRFQFKSLYKHKTVRLGTINLELKAGLTLQDLPYQKLFAGEANAISTNNFWERASGPADRNSFETMRFNEFISNRILQLQWRQDFKSLLFKRGDFAPHIELVNRFAIGSLNEPSSHQGVLFKTLEQGYFESGLELNRLWTWSPVNLGLGLGFYYRYGAYQFEAFEQNLAIKLTSKFQL